MPKTGSGGLGSTESGVLHPVHGIDHDISTQARSIILTGLTTGMVVQVRARALGGSTGQSGWSMPGSSIVD